MVVEFAEPLSGPGRTLRVTALARVLFRAFLATARPRARRAPFGRKARSRCTCLRISNSANYRPATRQAKLIFPAAPRSGETHQFHCLNADGQLEVFVRPRTAHVVSAGRIDAEVGRSASKRPIGQRLHIKFGETYRLQSSLPAGWIIDSLESTPPAALEDWTVVNTGERTSQLNIRLARPVTARAAAAIAIAGASPPAASQRTLAAGDYRVSQSRDPAASRRVIALQTDALRQLALEAILDSNGSIRVR